MKANKVKKNEIIKLLLGTSLLILSSKGYGECWTEIPANSGNRSYSPIPYTISVGEDFEIDQNLPIGTELLTKTLHTSTPTGRFICNDIIGEVSYEGTGTSNKASIYPIPHIPGLGYKITRTNDYSSHTNIPWFPTRATGVCVSKDKCFPTALFLTFDNRTKYILKLVKIGNIPHGGQLAGEIAKGIALEKGNFQFISLSIAGSINIKLISPSCKLKTPYVNVALGDISKSDFQGIRTETQRKQFNIGLECFGGSSGKTVLPKMTLEDVTNPSNHSDILTLSRNATAKGVGIRIYHKQNPVRYQPGNKIRLGELINGHYSIPFQANYIQSESTITPGSVHASAVFKLSYD
ncbi:fimbrial adhesin protein precursor [Xenorhabdus mauleonii]|uniref:Fimbrial adhesin protein n=1 Tax=Xenorhabdus mauleonii TaxID=351675 RepID=A0A1I3RAV8_9GAMM|nr:fimbrial protein [Xenorhabdus mauleonii]PHM39784.1 fimbrial adhesin protein precursor [Xenorhabdus mauleonii]SFJ42457.1 Pilin (type 1 fimbria component protein) [Xenorhabdus mauleonii]